MTSIPRRLTEFYPADCRPAGEPTPLGNAGGFSGSVLIRFDAARGPLLARGWPIGFPPEEAARIHSFARRLEPLGIVPSPITALDGSTARFLDGRVWEITPWIDSDESGHAGDGRFSASAFEALAAVHLRAAVPGLVGPSPGLIARLDEVERLLTSELERLRTVARVAVGETGLVARRWLTTVETPLVESRRTLARAARVVVPLCPCLRDPRPEHFLFRGGVLVGLVDLGAVGVESPAADVSRLLSTWFEEDRAARANALAAYERIRPLDSAERGLLAEFERSGVVLAPARWIRWLLVEQRPFPDRDLAERRFRDAVERYERRRRTLT